MILNKFYSKNKVRIYLAATMGYGLGSDDPEELSYYNKIRKDMEDMEKDVVKTMAQKMFAQTYLNIVEGKRLLNFRFF